MISKFYYWPDIIVHEGQSGLKINPAGNAEVRVVSSVIGIDEEFQL